jgi:hypothetical protein
MARVGSLERVMHPPEGGPQAAFRLAPRPPTGELPPSGDFKSGAAHNPRKPVPREKAGRAFSSVPIAWGAMTN